MDYKVILSPSARRDLQDIVRYISFDNPERAATFGMFLIDKTKLLSQFPELGREVPEIGKQHIREIVVKNYRVIYRVERTTGKIEVIRFWHAVRGTPEIYS